MTNKRLTIEVTKDQKQKQKLKVMAAQEGKTIKALILEKTIGTPENYLKNYKLFLPTKAKEAL